MKTQVVNLKNYGIVSSLLVSKPEPLIPFFFFCFFKGLYLYKIFFKESDLTNRTSGSGTFLMTTINPLKIMELTDGIFIAV